MVGIVLWFLVLIRMWNSVLELNMVWVSVIGMMISLLVFMFSFWLSDLSMLMMCRCWLLM